MTTEDVEIKLTADDVRELRQMLLDIEECMFASRLDERFSDMDRDWQLRKELLERILKQC